MKRNYQIDVTRPINEHDLIRQIAFHRENTISCEEAIAVLDK